MVKVKVCVTLNIAFITLGFNHPMVKVKAMREIEKRCGMERFNHPMVKVKGTKQFS